MQPELAFNSESPISIRRQLVEQVAHTNPTATGWAIQAARDIPRAQLLPAETRIQAEVPVTVQEKDGRLSYSADRRKLKTVGRISLEGVQALNGNPFSNIDGIGNPYHEDGQSTDVTAHEKGSRVADKIRHVRNVTGYMRDAMRAVYKPDSVPHIPGWIEFALSFPPLTSQIEDLAGLKDLPSLVGAIPLLNKLPGVRRLIPRPHVAKNDLVMTGIDMIPFSGAATQTVGRVLLPLPGSVSMMRHGNYVDNRVIEQYLPQSARRELSGAHPAAVTTRQEEFLHSADEIITQHPDEVMRLQKATLALLKKAGISKEATRTDFSMQHGKLTLTNDPANARVDLTEAQAQQLIDAVRTGTMTIKDLNNAMAGLDMMDTIKQTMLLLPQIANHQMSQLYRRT